MRILSLDLATLLGFAWGDSAEKPEKSGDYRLPSTGEDVGLFISCFDFWLRDEIEAAKPDLIVFEAPILAQKTTLATTRKLQGLAAMTEFIGTRLKVPCREAPLQSVKKFWTGDGRADKDAMVKMARVYGYAPRSDDEADAIAIFHYAASTYDKNATTTALGPLGAVAAQVEAAAKVKPKPRFGASYRRKRG